MKRNRRVKRMLPGMQQAKRLSKRRQTGIKIKATQLPQFRVVTGKAPVQVYFPLFRAKDYDPL